MRRAPNSSSRARKTRNADSSASPGWCANTELRILEVGHAACALRQPSLGIQQPTSLRPTQFGTAKTDAAA